MSVPEYTVARSGRYLPPPPPPPPTASEIMHKLQKKEKKEAGVCAKVRIQLSQKAVITRTAFNAKLDLENDGDIPLYRYVI